MHTARGEGMGDGAANAYNKRGRERKTGAANAHGKGIGDT